MRSLIIPALFALVGCTAGYRERTTVMPAEVSPDRTLTIELLALDLDTCGRCTGTSANLDAAIATVANVLREADVNVQVRKTIITTAPQAEQLRFESSPTIRINGRDIALELRESNCADCGDICGCTSGDSGGGGGGGVDCRVWVWQGREHTEAPKALIIDAILRAYYNAWEPAPAPDAPYRLPENLRKFFRAAPDAPSAASSADDCCDRTTCCEESERDSCCGSDARAGKHERCACEV